MGVRAAWAALFAGAAKEVKASAARPLFVQLGLSQPRLTPRRFDRLADEGYRKNIIVFRCVRLIAQNAAAVPWRLFRGRGGRRREIEDHSLLALLAHPNPLQGGAQFFEALYAFFLIAGNSFVEAAGPAERPPAELWCLRPDRVEVVPGERGLPIAYRFRVAGAHVDFPVDPISGRAAVLHSRAFHPLDDWHGLSPLEAAAFSIDQHNEAGKWNAALLQQGARPSGALVYAPKHPEAGDTLTPEQRQAIRAELEAFEAGARNAGRPLILEGGLDWREMSLSPKDMDWLAGKDVSAREIALAYNVPPQMVGIPDSQTFANFREARLSLFEDAVLPLLDFFKDEFNHWLAPAFDGEVMLDIDKDAIDALAPRRERTWERIRKADWLTINEKRRLTGFGDVAEGDGLESGPRTDSADPS